MLLYFVDKIRTDGGQSTEAQLVVEMEPEPDPTAETVAEAVARELAAFGVDRVFGLPGGESLYPIEALRTHGIEYVVCRHEADAGVMAAVYGKLRGTVGVVLTTLGPGASNLLFPIASSLLDREPLLAISAQTPASWPAARTHQRLPLLDVFRPVSKMVGSIDASNCHTLIRSALVTAASEPKGPAFLALSAENARTSAASNTAIASEASEHQSNWRMALVPPSIAAAQLSARLAAASRPLVLLGLGTPDELSPGLREWIRNWSLPVAVTPKVKGIVDEAEANFVGVVGGMAMDRAMVEALETSDLLVCFGLDPVEIDGDWHVNQPVVWVLETPWASGEYPTDHLIATDMSELLSVFSKCDAPRAWDENFADVRRKRRAHIEAGRASDSWATPVALVEALALSLPRETIVATDVGAHKYLFGQFWPSRDPGSFFTSNGLSGMGYGLPAAIAASLARPDATVLAVLGDGGFSMNSQELETAVRVGARVVVVVITDDSYSLIRIAQEARGLPRYGVDFGRIDVVGTAQACGVAALRVETPDQLKIAVTRAVAMRESLVVDVPFRDDAYAELI